MMLSRIICDKQTFDRKKLSVDRFTENFRNLIYFKLPEPKLLQLEPFWGEGKLAKTEPDIKKITVYIMLVSTKLQA